MPDAVGSLQGNCRSLAALEMTAAGAAHGMTPAGLDPSLPSGWQRRVSSVNAESGEERRQAREALVAELVEVAEQLPSRIDIDPEAVQRDLARLVLTLIELLRRVVEHQAIRRMEDGDLSDEQVERMGTALWRLEEKLAEIRESFGLAADELNIDLGPMGKLL